MRKIFLFSIVIFLNLILLSANTFAESTEEYVKTIRDSFGHNDLNKFIKAYGKPDIDDSTKNDTPRPPIVTRFITYYNSDIKILAIADANIGSPPPYKGWKVIGFTDSNSRAKLSASEAKQRLNKQLSMVEKK